MQILGKDEFKVKKIKKKRRPNWLMIEIKDDYKQGNNSHYWLTFA